MTLEDSIHSQRLRVLRDAERLGNVSEACRRHGMSRTCSIDCGGAWNSTARTGCIPSADARGPDGSRRFPCRRSAG